MNASLRRVHSPDVMDLESWQPEDPTDFGILVQLMVGPSDRPGEESFDLVLCTPTWLARAVVRQGPMNGRHHLIVERYDYGQLLRYVTDTIDACTGSSWNEVADKLARIARWEFEDYQEASP